LRADIRAVPFDLFVVDEAHKLRNAYRPSNKMGQDIRWAMEERKKLLLTATPLQNSLLSSVDSSNSISSVEVSLPINRSKCQTISWGSPGKTWHLGFHKQAVIVILATNDYNIVITALIEFSQRGEIIS
jgi:hypothetical protein